MLVACWTPSVGAQTGDRLHDQRERVEGLLETPEEASAESTPPPQRPIGGESRPLFSTGDLDENGQVKSGPGWVLETLTALGVVVGLVFLVRWLYVKGGGQVASRAHPAVEVLSRTTLAPRHQVVMLRVGGRILVVSESTASGGRTLAEITDPEEVADLLGQIESSKPESATQGFQGLLTRFNREEPELDGDAACGAGADWDWSADRARQSVSGLLSRVKQMTRGDTT